MYAVDTTQKLLGALRDLRDNVEMTTSDLIGVQPPAPPVPQVEVPGGEHYLLMSKLSEAIDIVAHVNERMLTIRSTLGLNMNETKLGPQDTYKTSQTRAY